MGMRKQGCTGMQTISFSHAVYPAGRVLFERMVRSRSSEVRDGA
jgi:hypothetical protein